KPVLVIGDRKHAKLLGDLGTLPQAMDAILDQTTPFIVVVRIEHSDDANQMKANVIGGVDEATGAYSGIQALKGAKAITGVEPRILIAPGFSSDVAVAGELIALANQVRGFTYLDGPNTNDADAINFVKNFGARRAEVIDPWITAFDAAAATEVVRAPSAYAAGLRARIDLEKGFWWSKSNQVIQAITGTTRPVDFKMGEPTTRANLLNKNHVTTIIREGGFRLWGSRTTELNDPKWAFEPVVRTSDLIADSIQRGLMWAVDRPINGAFLEDVAASVNGYITHLINIGALIGGKCWVDPVRNTPDQLSQGRAYFQYDFTAPAPAEQIGIDSINVQDYYAGVLPK
ncbi:MAG TPA: phage tail protein, partial [Pyrodictium sp.]|nr:phage tail protein [Pyrodictium sp.]